MRKNLISILIIASTFSVIDQISKALVVKYLALPHSIIGNFFTLTYSENTGIAFSIALPAVVIILLTVFFLAGLFYLAHKELNLSKPLARVALALIIGGGMGNLIDRLVHGFVIDFISIGNYPIFNLADVFITVGVILAFIFYNRIKIKS